MTTATTHAEVAEIARAAVARAGELDSYVDLLGLAACAVTDARIVVARAAGTYKIGDHVAMLDRAINDVLASWSTAPEARHLWEGFCAEIGADPTGPAEYDVTDHGTYRDDCDACLCDRHYCPVCRDAVGHGHSHE
jgi:hypothetical protein